MSTFPTADPIDHGRPPTTAPTTPFGQTLRLLRENRRLSQVGLANLSNLDPSTVSRFERGERDPTRETAARLAGALSLGAEATDALLASAGFAPLTARPDDALGGEPEMAALLSVLRDPAVPPLARASLREVARLLAEPWRGGR